MAKKKVFVDMDGTLCRFHDETDYLNRMHNEGFFLGLKPFVEAVNGIKRMIRNADADIYILSSSISELCSSEKEMWLRNYIPELNPSHILLIPVGERKSRYIPPEQGVFLLDDFNHNLEEAQNLVPVKAVNNINDKGLVGKKWEGYRVHVCSENFYEELKSILNTVPA